MKKAHPQDGFFYIRIVTIV